MRFALAALFVAFFAAFAMAVAPLHSVIISFPADAPMDLLDRAKQSVRDAKYEITHEYNIIKGFAALVPESFLEGIRALSDEFPPLIEGDSIMRTQDQKSGANKVGIA